MARAEQMMGREVGREVRGRGTRRTWPTFRVGRPEQGQDEAWRVSAVPLWQPRGSPSERTN